MVPVLIYCLCDMAVPLKDSLRKYYLAHFYWPALYLS